MKGWLWLDLNIIIGIKDYYNSIKANYFDNYKDQCKSEYVQRRYTIFYCEKNFDTKNFPTLLMQSQDLNYTFELTHKDLFEVRGDKKYFLITFDTSNVVPWRFGKTFLQKYFFNFDAENKIIEYYKPNSNNNNKREGNDINSENKILHSTISVMIFVLVLRLFPKSPLFFLVHSRNSFY